MGVLTEPTRVDSGNKKVVRQRVLGQLRALAPEQRQSWSEDIVARIRTQPAWREAHAVLAFFPMTEEVDIVPLLEEAISAWGRVWLPRIWGERIAFHEVRSLGRDTERGWQDLREPHATLPLLEPGSASGAILVITPGVAFDRAGNRLGRGRGFYDRSLAWLRSSRSGQVTSLAPAFSIQVLDRVPATAADQPVDAVVTENESITVRGP
jgi:5-formyltetrahydrofolate cyclo-ligase